jgi:FtsH-binding integral membrane protein
MSDPNDDARPSAVATLWTAAVFVTIGLAFLFFGRDTQEGGFIGFFVGLAGVASVVNALVRLRRGRRR